MTKTAHPASQAQFDYIKGLIESRELNADLEAKVTAARANYQTMTTKDASGLIAELQAAPRTTSNVDSTAKAEPGYYTYGERFIVVIENKAKTSTYAKRLVISETETGRKTAKWDYAPGVGRAVAGMEPMTLEQAKSFGHLHGFCFVCCKALTDPKSVEAGIGPVCSKKFPTRVEGDSVGAHVGAIVRAGHTVDVGYTYGT